MEKELKITYNEKQPSNSASEKQQQSLVDNALKGLYHGNFGTELSQETFIKIRETPATEKIILDKVAGTDCGEFVFSNLNIERWHGDLVNRSL